MRVSTCTMLVVGLALAALWREVPGARAQQQPPAATVRNPKQTAERRTALEMSYEHRDLEALPLLEALAAADPADWEVRERLAVSLVARSATVGREEASAVLRQARAILLDLQKNGKIGGLGEILLDGISPEGSPPVFSSSKDVQAAMKEGEAAFVRRDFDAARRAYQRAFKLDPRLYTAALFIGDTYFAQEQFPRARDWFARAVLIDPDREAAHRYHGDALSRVGNRAAARASYLDAILAEPYTRGPWQALVHWGNENGVRLGHPQIVPTELGDGPDARNAPKNPGAADDGRSHWRRYAETRAAWAGGRFKKTFPQENAYRHSLAEEADALRQVARAIAGDIKAGKVKEPNPCFVNLIKLDEEGLLEAHVLYARADEGISNDYLPYRAAHRGELKRYLRQYVAPAKGEETPAKKPR